MSYPARKMEIVCKGSRCGIPFIPDCVLLHIMDFVTVVLYTRSDGQGKAEREIVYFFRRWTLEIDRGAQTCVDNLNITLYVRILVFELSRIHLVYKTEIIF